MRRRWIWGLSAGLCLAVGVEITRAPAQPPSQTSGPPSPQRPVLVELSWPSATAPAATLLAMLHSASLRCGRIGVAPTDVKWDVAEQSVTAAFHGVPQNARALALAWHSCLAREIDHMPSASLGMPVPLRTTFDKVFDLLSGDATTLKAAPPSSRPPIKGPLPPATVRLAIDAKGTAGLARRLTLMAQAFTKADAHQGLGPLPTTALPTIEAPTQPARLFVDSTLHQVGYVGGVVWLGASSEADTGVETSLAHWIANAMESDGHTQLRVLRQGRRTALMLVVSAPPEALQATWRETLLQLRRRVTLAHVQAAKQQALAHSVSPTIAELAARERTGAASFVTDAQRLAALTPATLFSMAEKFPVAALWHNVYVMPPALSPSAWRRISRRPKRGP